MGPAHMVAGWIWQRASRPAGWRGGNQCHACGVTFRWSQVSVAVMACSVPQAVRIAKARLGSVGPSLQRLAEEVSEECRGEPGGLPQGSIGR